MSVEAMLRAAAGDIGYVETPVNRTKFGAWYGWDGVPWCDMAVSYWAASCGESKAIGKFAATRYHAAWYKSQGRLVTNPQPGDLVFFAWSGGGLSGINHIGIVEKLLPGNMMQTIEANTSNGQSLMARRNGGGVLRMKRSRTAYVACFARPNYTHPAPVKPASVRPARKPAALTLPSWYRRVITAGMRGTDVVQVQKRLNLFGGRLTVDGDYGPRTVGRVRVHQKAKRLAADGQVGPRTADTLGD